MGVVIVPVPPTRQISSPHLMYFPAVSVPRAPSNAIEVSAGAYPPALLTSADHDPCCPAMKSA